MGKDTVNKLKRYIKDDKPIRFRRYMLKHRIRLSEVKLSSHQTLLHYCCKHGTGSILRILLQEGLDPTVQDKNGETCLHVALRRILDMPFLSHISEDYTVIVSPLIERYPELLKIVDHNNLSCRELLAAVKCKQKRLKKENAECKEEQSDHHHKTSADEKHFFEKLSEEANNEYYDFMGKFEQDYKEPETYNETHEEWSDRIRGEYHRKKKREEEYMKNIRNRRRYERSAAERLEKVRERFKQTRQEMRERYERKHKAEQKLDIKKEKSKYETLFKRLCDDVSDTPLLYRDIPWPFQNNLSIAGLKKFLLCDISDSDKDGRKKYLREQQVRWHPDKFIQRFGERIHGQEGERIMVTVKEISQILNDISSSL